MDIFSFPLCWLDTQVSQKSLDCSPQVANVLVGDAPQVHRNVDGSHSTKIGTGRSPLLYFKDLLRMNHPSGGMWCGNHVDAWNVRVLRLKNCGGQMCGFRIWSTHWPLFSIIKPRSLLRGWALNTAKGRAVSPYALPSRSKAPCYPFSLVVIICSSSLHPG